MTTESAESAFAPTEDSDNATGYEANTENADGKRIFHFYFIISKFYCHLLNHTWKIQISSLRCSQR